jgi:flagellar biosynthesis/type III secretory pathway chaperone
MNQILLFDIFDKDLKTKEFLFSLIKFWNSSMINMEGNMGDWVNELCKLFEQEIGLYNRLLQLELEKREAVNSANGKALQSLAKETYNLMVNASELERVRMNSIEDVYKKNNLETGSDGITLTDFLNKIDRNSNFQLKSFATELKTSVHKLKDAIIINEKLIQTRQNLLQKTIQEMQKAGSDTTYSPQTKTKSGITKSRALVLDASA